MATLTITPYQTYFNFVITGMSSMPSNSKLALTTTNYGSSYSGQINDPFFVNSIAAGQTGYMGSYTSGDSAYLSFTSGQTITVYAYRYTDKWYLIDSDTFTVPFPVPNMPNSPVTATRIEGGFNLDWGDSINVTVYALSYGTVSTATGSVLYTSSSYYNGLTSLLFGTTYYFKVRAENSFGQSYWTTITSATTMPKIPTLSQYSVDNTEITISISSMAGNYTGIRVYLFDSTGNTQLDYRDIGGTYAIFSGLIPNTTYKIKAKSYININDTTIWSSGYSNIVTSTTTNPKPTVPSGVVASYYGTNGFDLQWGISNYATSYGLFYYYLIDGTMTGAIGETYYTNSCRIIGLTYGRTYYFTVNGVNGAVGSAWSDTTWATIKPQIPTITSGNITASSVRITANTMYGLWDSITVYQYASNGTTLIATGTILNGGINYVDFTNLAAGTTYIFKAKSTKSTDQSVLLDSNLSSGISVTALSYIRPSNWIWTTTELASLTNSGFVTIITYNRWNDFIYRVEEFVNYYNIKNGTTIPSVLSALTSSADKTLYAIDFNIINLSVNAMYSTNITVKNKGQNVLGSYFITLTECVNNIF